jgi:hypothetical protein
MSQTNPQRGFRAVHRVPKIGIPLLLFTVLWVVAGDKRLMDTFARFAFDAYLVGILVVGIAVAITILVLSRGRS